MSGQAFEPGVAICTGTTNEKRVVLPLLLPSDDEVNSFDLAINLPPSFI
jgi:hypothetical protein